MNPIAVFKEHRERPGGQLLEVDVPPRLVDGQPAPWSARRDAPSCELLACPKKCVHAYGYISPEARDQSIAHGIRIAGYAPQFPITRAKAALVIPYRAAAVIDDPDLWTEIVSGNSRAATRVQELLDAEGRSVAMMPIPGNPAACGLVIRHSYLEECGAPEPVLYEVPVATKPVALWDRQRSKLPKRLDLWADGIALIIIIIKIIVETVFS